MGIRARSVHPPLVLNHRCCDIVPSGRPDVGDATDTAEKPVTRRTSKGMGQEIDRTQFAERDCLRFLQYLEQETASFSKLLQQGGVSSAGPVAGCELEGWLVRPDMSPAPINEDFLNRFEDPASSAELARFNVEFNTPALPLRGSVLAELHGVLDSVLERARAAAESLGVELLLIGILPTLQDSQLNLANLSNLNRYRALNEQIVAARQGQPIRLNICGHQHLESVHDDVMLEAATTSFQIHWQIPAEHSLRYYNAALIASAPAVAVSANSPFLFGFDLWAETRIPLFEQAIPVGGYRGAAHGPLHRVSFGTGWARQSIAEVFEENLQHFPVLLPILFATDPAQFSHLRLHNGTIWRWNRPLVGFDSDGTPHVRLEHRTIPAGPTVVDMVANAAFFYGLVESLIEEVEPPTLGFAEAKDNFYLAARHGLSATLIWGGEHRPLASLIARQLMPRARCGLEKLAISTADIDHYLGIIEARVVSGRTGSEWQRNFIARHPGEFRAMTREYLNNQLGGQPVHEWDP